MFAKHLQPNPVVISATSHDTKALKIFTTKFQTDFIVLVSAGGVCDVFSRSSLQTNFQQHGKSSDKSYIVERPSLN